MILPAQSISKPRSEQVYRRLWLKVPPLFPSFEGISIVLNLCPLTHQPPPLFGKPIQVKHNLVNLLSTRSTSRSRSSRTLEEVCRRGAKRAWRFSISSTLETIASCICRSVGSEQSIHLIGKVTKYCFVQVIQPPRNLLLICHRFQKINLELAKPRTYSG